MKRKILFTIATFMLLTFPASVFTQVLDLGTIANFVIFTSSGAEANTGTSTITGDVGTDLGASSLTGAAITGSVNNANTITNQAKIDLQSTYVQLMTIPITNAVHAPAFGSGEVLTTGVYLISGAGSVAGNLTLNGLGDPNAVFIFKFGGAFASGAVTNVILINGTQACNVFWLCEGAISMAASTTMKGTLLANNGAVSMAAGGDLEGRMLSTSGAIAFGPVVAYKPICTTTVPLTAYSPCYNIILGSAANFVNFTSTGAVGNTGASTLTGDIGSDVGAISGFGTSTLIGSFYNVDAVTAQAKIDLQAAYIQLVSVPVTHAVHAPAYGSGEVLFTGVYAIGGAGSVAGTLTLDGQGDVDAVFIFKFGGAFTTGAGSTIVLSNGTSACNVFWLAEGAISMAAATTMKGTLIANNAANSMAAGGDLEGRMLSTTGAIAVDQVIAYKTLTCLCPPPSPLPIQLTNFTAECDNQNIHLEWSTASEINNAHFSIERSSNGINWGQIAQIEGAGNSTIVQNYSFNDEQRYQEVSYYRIKQTDHNGLVELHNTISVPNCWKDLSGLEIYPNPTKGTFSVFFEEEKNEVLSIAVYNVLGERIYYSDNYQSIIQLEDAFPGFYFVRVNLVSNNLIRKFEVVN